MTEKENENDAAGLSLAQGLKTMKEQIIKNSTMGPDGMLHLDRKKLTLDPASGLLREAINKFTNDPNNSNVLFEVLTGHSGITTQSLIPNIRGGFRSLEFVSNILSSFKRGVGFDLTAIDNSMRVLTNSMMRSLDGRVARRAVGVTTEAQDETLRIYKDSMQNDPTISRRDTEGLPPTIQFYKGSEKERNVPTEEAIKTIMNDLGWDRKRAIDELKKELGGAKSP